MKKTRQKEQDTLADLFEWTPRNVPDKEVWEILRDLGRPPEELPDPKDRAKYRRFLETHSAHSKSE